MQPTRGLDIGAIDYVHARFMELRNSGVAILLVSTELDEIMTLSEAARLGDLARHLLTDELWGGLAIG
jgi:ABC-type uncharacterized transport system ATPase subunit